MEEALLDAPCPAQAQETAPPLGPSSHWKSMRPSGHPAAHCWRRAAQKADSPSGRALATSSRPARRQRASDRDGMAAEYSGR